MSEGIGTPAEVAETTVMKPLTHPLRLPLRTGAVQRIFSDTRFRTSILLIINGNLQITME
jgi:hypothetical protein